MELYTHIFEANDIFYIIQVEAKNEKISMKHWSEKLSDFKINNVGSKSIIKCISLIKDEKYLPINNTKNVWRFDIQLPKSFFVVEFIKTNKSAENKLFTTYFTYKGCSYIEQFNCAHIKKIKELWIKNTSKNKITFISETENRQLLRKIEKADIKKLEGLIGVWEIRTELNKEEILIYIVSTDNN